MLACSVGVVRCVQAIFLPAREASDARGRFWCWCAVWELSDGSELFCCRLAAREFQMRVNGSFAGAWREKRLMRVNCLFLTSDAACPLGLSGSFAGMQCESCQMRMNSISCAWREG